MAVVVIVPMETLTVVHTLLQSTTLSTEMLTTVANALDFAARANQTDAPKSGSLTNAQNVNTVTSTSVKMHLPKLLT